MRPHRALPPKNVLESLISAYNTMRYDIGLLSKAEAEAMAEVGVTTGEWQKTAQAAPVTILETPLGDRVGFIRLPALIPGEDFLTPDQLRAVTNQIKSLRDKTLLIIGLSEWGFQAEQHYLRESPHFVPDILLGSGRGSGINGRVLADDRSIWVRTYDKGRSVAEIKIFEWPDRENSFAWKDLKNYTTKSIGLNDTYKDNREVVDVLQ